MPLSPEQLELIAGAREAMVETRSGDRFFRTVIWVVVDSGDVLVRSVRGDAGRWYQRALADASVRLGVGGEWFPFRAVPATDPGTIDRASEALRGKYPRGRSLDSMLRPEVLSTTLLLEPMG